MFLFSLALAQTENFEENQGAYQKKRDFCAKRLLTTCDLSSFDSQLLQQMAHVTSFALFLFCDQWSSAFKTALGSVRAWR